MPNTMPPDLSVTEPANPASFKGRRLWPYAILACAIFVGLAIAVWVVLTMPEVTTDGLVIVTSPSGAEVEYDGTSLGPAPVKLDRVRVGPHRFRFHKDGFASIEQVVQVDADRDGPLRFTLKPIPPEGSAARTPEEQVAEFRRLAGEAFDKGILVEPYVKSALYYADAILSVDAGNTDAIDIRKRIHDRMLAAARKALERREYSRAKVQFEQLLAAFPGDPEGVAGLEAARDPARRSLPRTARP